VKGNYAFRVSPGEYYLRLPGNWSKQRPITIADQKEIVRDDHVNQMEKHILRGIVVDKSGKPVPKAIIMGFGNGNDRIAGDNGRFTAELWLSQRYGEMCLYARSAEANLSGYKVISPEEKEATIEVENAPSLVGRVLDEAGKPVAGVPVYCNVFAPISDFQCYIHNKVETDKEGKYVIPALFVGFYGNKGDLSVSRFNTTENAYDVFNGPVMVVEPGVNHIDDIILNDESLAPSENRCGYCRIGEKPIVADDAGGPVRHLPEIDAAKAAKAAIAKYDADHDGKLDREELHECPGLLSVFSILDTNNDHEISADEIISRISFWRALQVARIAIECKATYQGKPLADAEIRFVPEDFLGESAPVAVGKTDAQGRAKMRIPSDGDAPPGAAPGFYRVEITKPGTDIPARYNKKTILGVEISLDADILRDGLLRFDLY
jgi:hypothetical protein